MFWRQHWRHHFDQKLDRKIVRHVTVPKIVRIDKVNVDSASYGSLILSIRDETKKSIFSCKDHLSSLKSDRVPTFKSGLGARLRQYTNQDWYIRNCTFPV